MTGALLARSPLLALAAGGVAALLACSPASEITGRASEGLVFVRHTLSTHKGVQGSDLFRARISDGAVRVLWETPEREEMWPYWSDAAEKLVFEARLMGQPATDSDRAIEQRLWLWDPATARESLLSKSPALLEHWANWSPQGDRIVFAFSSHPDDPADAGLAIAEVGSGRRTVAASSPAATRMFRPRFSPDGRRLVAQRWSRSSATSKVWIFDAGTPRPLGRGRFGVDGKPRFTRDGESVVFTRRALARGEGDIWIIGADGRGARRVFSVEGADDHAADPSPTRDEIAFSSNRSGDYEIWLADLASGELRNLTHTPETAEGAARWSPDGERLVVSVTPAGVDPSELEAHERPTPRLAVLDREGRVLFETEGYSADWMPPWK